MNSNTIVDYIRDNGKLIGCVVAVNDNGRLGVGVSLCNRKDVFVKKIGREIATSRALKSLENSDRGLPGWSDETRTRHVWLPSSKDEIAREAYENMVKKSVRVFKGVS